MTLRTQLALRYALVVAGALIILGWLVHHEFIEEPALFRKYGIPEHESDQAGETAEVVLYGSIPLTFILGWLLVRKSLAPLNELAAGMERFHPRISGQRVPRTSNGDEVDRLSASFNQMAAQVEQSFLQVREFTLRASHELNTPLTVMRAHLETSLARGGPAALANPQGTLQLLDEVQRLSSIVDSLLLLSKADAGLITMERLPVALHELVHECHENALVLAESRSLRVSVVAAEITILGDRHRLRQLLLILADNAVKYSEPGGTVSIQLRQSGDAAVLAMTNSGPGMTPELQAKVFDRFVRGPQAAANKVEGCGLGLPIARWIVEAHSGTISVTSSPSGPTAFKVSLPIPPRAVAEPSAGSL